ncbi:SCO7613 C-terminal domain-containing membrane protein [Streptomyces cavernae]|uniref:SCO7613 C-terminal domain-containing membrane protein n=1 Tax=Streptomyces cavernae TaxID=2259034 RepID=UPI001EE4A86A|nr:hypothetical protein [Streptomyces cavernae]
MTTFPPPAEELRLLENELRQLDARRAQLLARRAWLLSVLAPPSPTAGGEWAGAAVWRAPAPTGDRPEATAPGVQNVLLLLGGVLLTIAAMVFTLVSWGHLGIGGRAAVLGAVTLATLGAPALLLRRGLRSTAESVAGLGMALTLLDAYALHEVAFPDSDGIGYMAVASAVLAATWTAYGRALGALRLPLPAALAAAHLPLLLWVVSNNAGPYMITGALLAPAAADVLVALRVSLRTVRIVAVAGGCSVGAGAVLVAGSLSWSAAGPGDAAKAAALLMPAAAIALAAAWQPGTGRGAPVAAGASGLLLVAAVGGIPRSVLPGDWTVLGYLLCGVALLTVLRASSVPEAVRRGFLLASGAVQGVALLTTLLPFTLCLAGPVDWTSRVWSGAPADARAAVTVGTPWLADSAVAPLVLAVVAVVLASAPAAARRPGSLVGALVLVWAAVLVLPPALALPYPAALTTEVLVTAAALALAAYLSRHRRPRSGATPSETEPAPAATPSEQQSQYLAVTAALLALLTSLSLACLALADRSATLVVFPVLAVLFAGGGYLTRRWQQVGSAACCASVAYATGVACAAGAALGWEAHFVALLVLLVPLAVAVLAPRLANPVPVEIAGAAAAAFAVALTLSEPPVLALVLALTGVIAAGTAIRADRRGVGYAAGALFVLATWVRLASWGVGTPEAYALPAALPALVVGVLRHLRDPRVSSWTAYGPGLATALVPSLLAVLGDPDWVRPLLLGTAALLITLAGARHRLQAPLLLGGGTLALVALHELSPYLVQLAGVLPRWLPPALAGLALLALGATYEQRLRDARRVREVLGRMR